MSNPRPARRRSPGTPRRRTRDRRGRGLRAPLLPQNVPAWTTRAEGFDSVVLTAYAPIYKRWQARLEDVDLAVDDVPRMLPKDPSSVVWPPEVAADGAVPLARLLPPGVDPNGAPTRARILVFRRPIESRAKRGADLLALVHEVLVQQVAAHLGLDEDTVDPL